MHFDPQRLQKLHAQTSPGAWARVGPDVYAGPGPEPVVRALARGVQQHQDAAFITEVHAALPALLAELERLWALEDTQHST
jgi:hypothetical protein